MCNRGEGQLHVLVIKRRALRSGGVIMRQNLAVSAYVIRPDFHAHLLSTLLQTLLRLVDDTGDPLRVVELEHNVLGYIGPGARPTRGTRPEVPVNQVLERMSRVLRRVSECGVTGEVY